MQLELFHTLFGIHSLISFSYNSFLSPPITTSFFETLSVGTNPTFGENNNTALISLNAGIQIYPRLSVYNYPFGGFNSMLPLLVMTLWVTMMATFSALSNSPMQLTPKSILPTLT